MSKSLRAAWARAQRQRPIPTCQPRCWGTTHACAAPRPHRASYQQPSNKIHSCSLRHPLHFRSRLFPFGPRCRLSPALRFVYSPNHHLTTWDLHTYMDVTTHSPDTLHPAALGSVEPQDDSPMTRARATRLGQPARRPSCCRSGHLDAAHRGPTPGARSCALTVVAWLAKHSTAASPKADQEKWAQPTRIV